MTVEVVEGWTVIDRWWQPDGGVRRQFADVRWGTRRVVMVREPGDPVWRVVR